MVLTTRRAWLAPFLLSLAAANISAQTQGGFRKRPQTAADTAGRLGRGWVAFSGFSGRSGGPRPLLLGFALECTRCQPTNLRGGFGAGPNAIWHYQEFPRVAVVVEGGPAARAGIREGDLLTDVGGASLITDLGAERFSALRVGDTASLTLERAGKPYNTTLVLGRGSGDGRGRMGGGGGPPRLGPQPLLFSTRVGATAVDVVSDIAVLSSTDSTGTTTLRIGSTTIRLRPTPPKSP